MNTDSLFSEALVLVERIDDPEMRSGALTSIAGDLFRSGKEEKPLEILRDMKVPKYRAVLLWNFTVWCAYHDRLEEMDRFRKQLETEQRNGTATPFGDPNYVETQIQRILESRNKPPAPVSKTETDDDSEPIAVSFDDPVEELIHYAHLSKRDLKVAIEKMKKAFGILQADHHPSEHRIRQLETVLYGLVEFHDPDTAIEVQKEIERLVRNTEFDTVVSADGLRHEAMKVIIAQGYANERRFDEAAALAREIENLSWRATTFAAVARIMEAIRRDPDFDITETM